VKRSSSPSQIAKAFYGTSAKGFAFRMLWGSELKIDFCTAARNRSLGMLLGQGDLEICLLLNDDFFYDMMILYRVTKER